jgi:hypothetical protein
MMGMMDTWVNELKPFQEYMEHAFEKKKMFWLQTQVQWLSP